MFSLNKKLPGSKALLNKAISLCLSVTFFFISLGVPTDQALLVGSKQYPVNNIGLIIDAVPTGDRWLQHLKGVDFLRDNALINNGKDGAYNIL